MSPRTRSWPSSRARADRPRAVVLDIGATADLDVATTDMLTALHAELREAGHRAPAGAGPRFRPRPDAPDRADDHDRRGPLLPVGRGGGRGAAADAIGSACDGRGDRRRRAAIGRAAGLTASGRVERRLDDHGDRLVEGASRVPAVARADHDAGRHDDAHHGQAEDHDIGRGRRRPGRSGLAGLMPQRRERRDAGRWHEGAEPQAGDQAAEVRGVVDRATRQRSRRRG